MKKLIPFVCAVVGFFSENIIFAQAVNYNDVVVIVNSTDTMSVNIGNYFMQKRNIPSNNIIRLNITNNEEITPAQWASIRTQVEDSLAWKGLTANYLVTTKGVPLKVSYGGSLLSPDPRNASVDSELMLVNGPSNSVIGGSAVLQHSYYNKNQHFSSATFGFYLVTRLTGYTQADVFNLIDNSGPKTYVSKSIGKFVLDAVPYSTGYGPSSHNTNIPVIQGLLTSAGWSNYFDTTTTYLQNKTNVLGYWSWGSNDVTANNGTAAIPGNTWTKASIAETAVSTSARSFLPGTSYGQSLVADWIAEGVTGMSGFVYEPLLFSVADPALLFSRYTNTTAGYNLAESFYMASPTISWMQIVVGDPKSSIVTTTAGVEEDNADYIISVYPNPSNGIFQMDAELTSAKDVIISVSNMLGQEVYSEILPEANVYRQTIDISRFDKGLYILTLTSGEKKVTRKLMVD